MRFKPTIKGMITLLLGLVFVVITLMAASAVSEFSISGFSEWDSSVISSFSANITGYPYLTPYTAAEYLFEWNTNDSVGTNHGTLSGYTLNNGTISGATTGVSGQYGEGVSFDGVDDRIQLPSGVLNESHGTVELWFKVPLNYIPPSNEFAFGHYNSGNRIYILNYAGDTAMRMQIGSGADFYIGSGINDGIYHHIAMTWNSSHMCGYIDGIFDECTTYTGLTSMTTAYIGDNPVSGGAEWNGSIDEVRIYDFTLTPTQINESMNSHFPVETPVLSYSFEAYNASHVFDTNWNVQGQDEAETGAISFNGSQEITISSLTQGATYNFWIKPQNEGVNQYIFYLLSNYVYFRDTGSVYRFNVRNSVGTTFNYDVSYSAIPENDWTMVSFVLDWDDGKLKLFIDGNFINQVSISGTADITNRAFEIGAAGGGTFWIGLLSDIEIFNRVLSADEVTYLYDNSKATYELTTSDGTLETQIPNSSPNQYNITVATNDHFPQSFTNQAVSSNLSVLFNQSVISFDSFEKFTGDQLSSTYTITHNDYADGGYYNEGSGLLESTSHVAATVPCGMEFVVNDDNLKLVKATYTAGYSNPDPTTAYLYANGTLLSTTTTITGGDTFVFSDILNLYKNTTYKIMANGGGAAYDCSEDAGISYPLSFTHFNFTAGFNELGNRDTGSRYLFNYLNLSKYDGQNSWTVTENETINLPVNTGWNVTASSGSYYDKKTTFNVTALENKTENVTGLFDTYLNITAKDSFNNNSINNFNLSITSNIFNESYEVTNYELIEAITGYEYTASAISTSNFLLGTDTLTPTTNLELWVLFLDPYNSVNITFREYDDTIINTTTINITILDGTTATNYNTTNGTLQLRLLAPNDYELRTTASGYNDRKYYFTVTNDSTQNINIYLETNVSTELQQIRILDTTNTEVTGAIVRVEKETTLGSNLWSNYAEETTNAEGIANTYLEKGISNYYRFAVFVDGAVIPIYPSGADYTVKTNFISGVTEIVDIVINLQAIEITDYYEELYSVSTNMGFVGNDTVWFSWVDAQNTISGAKLVIKGKYIDNTTAWETINTQTSSATSGNLTYTFTPINNTIYQAYGYIIYSDRESLAQTATKSYGVTSFVEKNTGLLLAVLILAVTAFLTVSFGVLLSGVMTVLMLVFTNIIGLTNFPTTIITSLLALFIILLIRITKGDEG